MGLQLPNINRRYFGIAGLSPVTSAPQQAPAPQPNAAVYPSASNPYVYPTQQPQPQAQHPAPIHNLFQINQAPKSPWDYALNLGAGFGNSIYHTTSLPFATGEALAAQLMHKSSKDQAKANSDLQQTWQQSIPGGITNNVYNTGATLADMGVSAAAGVLGNQGVVNEANQEAQQHLNQTAIGSAVRLATAGGAAAAGNNLLKNGTDPNIVTNAMDSVTGPQGISTQDPSSTSTLVGDALSTATAPLALAGGSVALGLARKGYAALRAAPVDAAESAAKASQAVTDQTAHPVESTPPVKAAGTTIPEANTGAGVTAKPVKSGIGAVDTAIQNMIDHYNSAFTPTGSRLGDFLQVVKGKIAGGDYRANQLGSAIRRNLTDAENKAVYDALQGVKNPDLTPKAARVAKSLKPLYDTGYGVRAAIDPKVGRVGQYAPRILRDTVSNAAKTAGGIKDVIQNALAPNSFELGNSKPRQIGKFVGSDGNTIIGKPSDNGLVLHRDGTISNGKTGKNKVTYTAAQTNTHEISQATGLQYLDKSSHVSQLYHSATARLQAKTAALNELNANPAQHGLFTAEQLESAGTDTSKMREVQVNGLKDANGNNFYAAAKDARAINNDSLFKMRDDRNIFGKAYDKVGSLVTQAIVLNPWFHGANQLVQSLIAVGNMRGAAGGGWVKLAKNVLSVKPDDVYSYLDAGGHVPDYGSHNTGFLSKMTFGASKLSSKGMYQIELGLRTGLFKTAMETGMDAHEAVGIIDKFLGDSHAMGRVAQRTLLFSHYMKTMGGALYEQARHPIANSGANINAIAVTGVLLAINYEWQQFTGNKDAYARLPGEIGLLKELGKVPGEIAGGSVPSLVMNHVNPMVKEGVQQVTNKDLFTDKAVTDTGRLTHAIDTLFAPTTQINQVADQKRSSAEIAENQLGLYTPHAKGYSAVDKNSPLAGVLNQPIDGQATLPGNGEAAQKAYFDGLHQAQIAVQGDKKTAAQLADYLARSHDPTTGQTIRNSPSQSIQNANALFANDKLRQTVQQMEKSQPNHDPMWDLPDDKLKALMDYREQYTGSTEKTVLHDQATDPNTGDNWIDDVTNQTQNYYNNLPAIPGSKGSISNGPQYPTFDQQTTDIMNQYNSADSVTKATLMQQYPGILSAAFDKIGQYTNDMRKAEGAPAKNNYPQATPEVQQIINDYNALPQHDGKRGGNASRYAWIQAHPDEYNKMQNYMTAATMYSLTSEAAKAQFAGVVPSQKLLKDIKNVGQYDIASTKGPNGQLAYSLNPQAAYSQSKSSTGSSLASSKSYSSSSRSSSSKKMKVRPSQLFGKYVNSGSTLVKNKNFKSKSFQPQLHKGRAISLKKAPGMKAPRVASVKLVKPHVGIAHGKSHTVKLKV